MSDPLIVNGPAPRAGGLLHATAVAYGGAGVLILGASGRGKSALALELMAYGAVLIADDQTHLERQAGRLIADVPATIRGRIEARFVGILRAEAAGPTPIVLVVDMDHEEITRLPVKRAMILLGESLPVLHYSAQPHFPAAILQFLKCAQSE